MHGEKPRESYPLGAHVLPGSRCSFKVWAPRAHGLQLEILPRHDAGETRLYDLEPHGDVLGVVVDDVVDGDRYHFVFPDGRRRPDPRSRRQPDGVHGPSAVVDTAALGFSAIRGDRLDAREHVIYELHVGTFSRRGTFDGVIDRLSHLRDELGVTAIEILPVSSFPGRRNWGYDGVHLFSVQESYGGPKGLARLVQAAHEANLAVILDVVYNHFGPEGNYLREFGPYFTRKHATPWGEAINFDDEGAGFVRSFVIDNALQWIRDYRIDGLRLDAIHAIADDSHPHVLAEVGAAVQAVGGFVIAESDRNDPVTILGRPDGWGHDAQWSDDLHHALHALVTGERSGYYEDYGQVGDVAGALERGFLYDGSRPSAFRGGRHHGMSTRGIPAERHVVCIQNHDQVGNRARGDRIAHIAGTEAAKVAAATVLLAPGIPLLFMGEEYAAPQPFPYFTSHSDPQLAKAVTEGRRREFAAFSWQGEVPDPQAEETFLSAVLLPDDHERAPHAGVFAFYKALIDLRRNHPACRGDERQTRTSVGFDEATKVLWMERWSGQGKRLLAIFSYGAEPVRLAATLPQGPWQLAIDSGGGRFGGGGGTAPATLEGGTSTLELQPTTAWVYTA